MLVLSRKIGEKIQIGEDIVLTVLEIKGGRVKLGLVAPAACPIQRSELIPLPLRNATPESSDSAWPARRTIPLKTVPSST